MIDIEDKAYEGGKRDKSTLETTYKDIADRGNAPKSATSKFGDDYKKEISRLNEKVEKMNEFIQTLQQSQNPKLTPDQEYLNQNVAELFGKLKEDVESYRGLGNFESDEELKAPKEDVHSEGKQKEDERKKKDLYKQSDDHNQILIQALEKRNVDLQVFQNI